METMQDIALRLKSVGSTRQITQSMGLIATRKVQKIKERLAQNQPYHDHYAHIAHTLAHAPQFAAHPYVAGRDGRALVVVITGDRGLCGGYNIQVEKQAQALCARLGGADLITVGSKGRDYFRHTGLSVVQSFKGLSENPFYKDARQVAETALDRFDSGAAAQIHLVYTRYETMLHQTPVCVRLLPLERGEGLGPPSHDADFVFGGDRFFERFMADYLSSALFGAMLTAALSEQCARVTGMKAAADNAKKIIDGLALSYNQMRQGAITQEIAEIVGGAAATEHPGG